MAETDIDSVIARLEEVLRPFNTALAGMPMPAAVGACAYALAAIRHIQSQLEAEREECAQIADVFAGKSLTDDSVKTRTSLRVHNVDLMTATGEAIAAAIRSRSPKGGER